MADHPKLTYAQVIALQTCQDHTLVHRGKSWSTPECQKRIFQCRTIDKLWDLGLIILRDREPQEMRITDAGVLWLLDENWRKHK